jgi:hypothetical protein
MFNELAEANKLALEICKELVTALTLCENCSNAPLAILNPYNLFSAIDNLVDAADAEPSNDDAEIT